MADRPSTSCSSAPAIPRARSSPRRSSTRSGAGRFQAFSAGSQPKGQVQSGRRSICCASLDFDVSRVRSKSWAEFASPARPTLDFVFTVCDNAAGEACPFWPGQPMTAHWGIPDPAAAEGSEVEIALAFKDAFRMLSQRIDLFLALPIGKLDRLVLTSAAQRHRPQEGATGKGRQHVDV